MSDSFDALPENKALLGLGRWLDRHRWIFPALLGLTAFNALLLFEFKVSEGGDDSSYIMRAFDLVREGTYPTYQGPAYPFFLAPWVALMGIHVPVLKLTSYLSILGFSWITYRSLRHRLPLVPLFLTLGLCALSPVLLYFASQTYSEAFYMIVQAGFLALAIRYLVEAERISWTQALLLALAFWLLANTRTIGYAALPVLWLHLGLHKRWADLGKTTAAIVGVLFAWEGLKRLIWGADDLQFASQGKTHLQKNAYDASEGNEDLMGLLQRAWENMEGYLSKHFLHFIGFQKPEDMTENVVVGLLVVLLLIGVGLYAFRKNKSLYFLSLYTAALLAGNFLGVHANWDQVRLVIPYFPYVILIVLSGGWLLSVHSNVKWAAPVLTGIASLSLLLVTGTLNQSIQANGPEFRAGIAGGPLAGYTPDWYNYVRMTEYAAANVPDSVGIACRKAGISFIYGQRKFKGITRIPYSVADSLEARHPHWVVVRTPEVGRWMNTFGLTQQDRVALASGRPKPNTFQAAEGEFFEVLRMPAPVPDSLIDKANVWTDLSDFVGMLEEGFVVEPDRLVEELRKDRVRYLIEASLRVDPNRVTDRTVNTITRYLYYIQLKYPNSFRQIHAIGTSEPAYLLELDFATIDRLRAQGR